MARRRARPAPTKEQSLEPVCTQCPECGSMMWADYSNHRTLVTLSGLVRLKLRIRRCPNAKCSRYHRPYRPEAEGALALPHHEVGLDVIALVGALEREVESRSDDEAGVVRGYCAAVRSALTDDGRPPLEAAGLVLHERLSAIEQSLAEAGKKGLCLRR